MYIENWLHLRPEKRTKIALVHELIFIANSVFANLLFLILKPLQRILIKTALRHLKPIKIDLKGYLHGKFPVKFFNI
jgi:hypothetical protein